MQTQDFKINQILKINKGRDGVYRVINHGQYNSERYMDIENVKTKKITSLYNSQLIYYDIRILS